MIHHFGHKTTTSLLTLARGSAALGLALALGGCSSPLGPDAGMTKPEAMEATTGDLGAEVASGRPSPILTKRSTPAGLAVATLGLFKDGELDPSQELKLVALRANVFSAQRAIGAEMVARRDAARTGAADARDLEGLGAAMAEKQHALVDRALAGALDLRTTLSPAQRSAFVFRANDSERAARRHAAKLAAEGIEGRRRDDRIALALARADIFEELAKPVPDQTKVRTLGSAFVASHTRAIGASIIAPARPTANR